MQTISRFLVHSALCGSAGWAISRTNCDKYPYLCASYAFVLVHGYLGLVPKNNQRTWMNKLYQKSSIIAATAPIIALNFYLLWENYHDLNISNYHAVCSIVPIVLELVWPDPTDLGVLCVTIANICSLGFMSIEMDNLNTLLISAAICKFFDDLMFQSIAVEYNCFISRETVSVLGMTCFLALTSLSLKL